MDRPTPSTPSSSPPTLSSKSSTSSYARRSNDTYFYGVGILAVLAIGVCVLFGYNIFHPKKTTNDEKQDQPPKR